MMGMNERVEFARNLQAWAGVRVCMSLAGTEKEHGLNAMAMIL